MMRRSRSKLLLAAAPANLPPPPLFARRSQPYEHDIPILRGVAEEGETSRGVGCARVGQGSEEACAGPVSSPSHQVPMLRRSLLLRGSPPFKVIYREA